MDSRSIFSPVSDSFGNVAISLRRDQRRRNNSAVLSGSFWHGNSLRQRRIRRMSRGNLSQARATQVFSPFARHFERPPEDQHRVV